MKKTLLTIIITAVICTFSTIIAAVTIIDSKDVLYMDKNDNESNVKDALDTLYDDINVGTATANDILAGKTALSKGKLVTGNYKLPGINIYIQVGSHGSAETTHQTRVNMAAYAGIYKYFKIVNASCDTNGLCSNIYYNSSCDQASGNMSLNTQYETNSYPGFTIFTTGAKSYYYTITIYLYN